MNEELLNWIQTLCQLAGETESYTQNFIASCEQYPDILEELTYYAYHGEFADQVDIKGYGIIDILVWQIDHFKSHMDRGEYDMQSNPEKMVLSAFDTLLQMKKKPEPIILAMQSETGTDYAEKY